MIYIGNNNVLLAFGSPRSDFQLIDFSGQDRSCRKLPNIPQPRSMGGLISSTPTIITPNEGACYELDVASGNWTRIDAVMNMKHSYTTTAVFGDELWVVGGMVSDYSSAATEYYDFKKKTFYRGQDMPYKNTRGNLIKVNSTTGIIVGIYVE